MDRRASIGPGIVDARAQEIQNALATADQISPSSTDLRSSKTRRHFPKGVNIVLAGLSSILVASCAPNPIVRADNSPRTSISTPTDHVLIPAQGASADGGFGPPDPPTPEPFTPEPTSTPEPTATPTPEPTPTPIPTSESKGPPPEDTATPEPPTPKPSITPIPSATPKPSITPRPSATIQPTLEPTPTKTPVPPTNTPEVGSLPLEFKFGPDISAADKAFIRKVGSWGESFWGKESRNMTIYAEGSIDALLQAYANNGGFIHPYMAEELRLPGHIETTAPGALLIVASKSGEWPKMSEATKLEHLLHSINHSEQRGHSGGHLAPTWFAEGGADYGMAKMTDKNFTPGFYANYRKNVISEIKTMILPLSQLENWPITPQRAPYALGFLANEYLASKYGDASVLRFWKNYGTVVDPQTGNGWREAFQTTFGITLAQFYQDFDAYVAQLRR